MLFCAGGYGSMTNVIKKSFKRETGVCENPSMSLAAVGTQSAAQHHSATVVVVVVQQYSISTAIQQCSSSPCLVPGGVTGVFLWQRGSSRGRLELLSWVSLLCVRLPVSRVGQYLSRGEGFHNAASPEGPLCEDVGVAVHPAPVVRHAPRRAARSR